MSSASTRRSSSAARRRSPLVRWALALTAAIAVVAPPAARANASQDKEMARVADILQSTLVAHGAEVHRCFERALADTLDVSGKIELEVDVGAGGRVTKAAPSLDEVKSPVLLACLQESAVTWSFAGVEPGSTVIVPLAFEGQAAQFTIKVKDAPEHGPPVPKGKHGAGAAPAVPPFSVKLLVDEATMHAQKAALAQLTVAPANRIALHRHPGAEVLYVLHGHARVLGPAGIAAEKLDEGMAIFIPPGMPHAIENMGRQSSAVLLDLFVPPGPERVYRDPKDEAGRAAFEVLHDPKVTAPAGAHFVVASPAQAPALPILGGKGKSRALLGPAQTGDHDFYLGTLEAEPGAEVPRNTHPGSAEILFVVTGTGDLTVGSEKFPFEADEALYLPENQPHAAKFSGADKALLVQIFAPAGPEAAAAPAPTKAPPPRTEQMIDFELSDEQRVLQKSVRELCDRLIVPHARRWDEEEHFPQEIIPALGEMGLLGMQVPERYGGAGMKFHDYVVALEEVARADASVGLTMASHNSLCSGHILLAGSEAVKKRFLPQLASGKVLGGWGLTEPGSGSDAGAARTRAVRKGGGWVITGSKTFITQGSVGGIFVVLASTSPEKKAKGLTAFVVERGTPGFRTGKKIQKMGLRASDTTELVFEEVEIPDEQRLGEIDGGFYDTLKILDRGRIGIGAWSVGIGRASFEAARRYAKERVQFGKALGAFQGIQHMLADMATELDAARLLVWRAAWMQDQGLRTTAESSVAKYYAARATMRACNSAVQIHGGYGYTREFDVERYLRDAKLAEIGEGTNEVQKMVIARELLRVAAEGA